MLDAVYGDGARGRGPAGGCERRFYSRHLPEGSFSVTRTIPSLAGLIARRTSLRRRLAPPILRPELILRFLLSVFSKAAARPSFDASNPIQGAKSGCGVEGGTSNWSGFISSRHLAARGGNGVTWTDGPDAAAGTRLALRKPAVADPRGISPSPPKP